MTSSKKNCFVLYFFQSGYLRLTGSASHRCKSLIIAVHFDGVFIDFILNEKARLGKGRILNNDMSMLSNLPLPIGIIGYGLSGKAAHRLLVSSGISSKEIFVFDENKNIESDLGLDHFISKHLLKTLVVSPGFPLSHPVLKKSHAAGLFITSELSLASAFLKKERLIGITGSMGKSTATSLINWSLQKSQISSLALGNIGVTLADYIADVIENKRASVDWIILELSSYQLENCDGLQLAAAAITAFEPNHLDRYISLEEYYSTKLNILNLLKGPFVANQHSPDLFGHPALSKESKNIYWSRTTDPLVKQFQLQNNLLLGQHQLQNISLAANILQLCHLEIAIPHLKSFSGLPHRLELIELSEERVLVNDSKATSIQSVLAAAEAVVERFGDLRPVYVLLGGKDKGLPWEDLRVLTKYKNLKFKFFGECAQMAKSRSLLTGPVFNHLKDCLLETKSHFQRKEIILLSPGGTSQDEFKNFEVRGEFFKNNFIETR
jgi:UDP-N-acetylmuramoylalanine--D-glutamate ligase